MLAGCGCFSAAECFLILLNFSIFLSSFIWHLCLLHMFPFIPCQSYDTRKGQGRGGGERGGISKWDFIKILSERQLVQIIIAL